MTPIEPVPLPEADWDRHQAIIAGFEAAWRRGDRPKISEFLPADELRRDELLIELVHADLEFRIKSGESARVEDYLHKYPSLGRGKEAVLGLIRAEFSVRVRKDPTLKLDRYRRRFPDFRTELGLSDRDDSSVDAPPPAPAPVPGSRPRSPVEGPFPRSFGKFVLREKLGVGSFGVVFRAWDTVLKREVAVKVPRVEGASFGPELRVFLRDARNSLYLKHPNIVEMLDAGPVEGVDCLVRAYIEGRTLADRLREGPPGIRETATMLVLVADAVEHFQSRGITHRDLKPSNILIDREGQPYVMDFGLAKHESGDSTLSPVGSPGPLIGTLAYMSPEQARGETYLVDARSDVYSLGVILYEMLTGSLPYRGRGRMLQIQIEEGDPIPPRGLNDDVPGELEVVCLKALAVDPASRYQSAKELGDDLRSFLEGRLVPTQPVGEPVSQSWWKQSRRIALISAGSVLILVLALVATILSWPKAERLARTSDARLDLGKAFDMAIADDPGGVEVAADAWLGLARRASLEKSDEEAGPIWDRAILASEASLAKRPGRPSRLDDLVGALTRRAEIWRRSGHPDEAKRLFDRAIQLGSQGRARR